MLGERLLDAAGIDVIADSPGVGAAQDGHAVEQVAHIDLNFSARTLLRLVFVNHAARFEL